MEDLILAILVGLALTAVRLRDLLAATAVLGAYSLMMALLWAYMNALDVSFTEAAVGAGISTVLMLAAIVRVGRRESAQLPGPLLRSSLRSIGSRLRDRDDRSSHARGARLGAVAACAIVAAALLYGMQDMPAVGAHDAPALLHPEVAQRYLHASPNRADGTLGEVGPANIITSVLGDYRGYDTMGETVVIFTAALCVVLLLRPGRRRRDESESEG
jgi:multicomponent Na+:H+ antiporter subunit B